MTPPPSSSARRSRSSKPAKSAAKATSKGRAAPAKKATTKKKTAISAKAGVKKKASAPKTQIKAKTSKPIAKSPAKAKLKQAAPKKSAPSLVRRKSPPARPVPAPVRSSATEAVAPPPKPLPPPAPSFQPAPEPLVPAFTPPHTELRPPQPPPPPARDLYRPSQPAPQPAARPPQPQPHHRPPAPPQQPRRDDRHPGMNQHRPQQPSQPRPPLQQPPQNQQRPPQQQRPAPAPPAPKPAAPAPAAAAQPPKPAELSPTAEAARKHHEEIFVKTQTFADLGLRDTVLRGVTDAGFQYPTTIQSQLIPLILSGKDMLGQAKTGTGKTAAFGLPLLSKIEKGIPFQAMVLVPTRELAIQVATDLKELGRFTGLHILPVYGGQNVGTQAGLLAKGPEIIVATPGRVMDMAQRNYLTYRNIKHVILDEVDRMLDIGFRDDIRKILSACPRERQTIFVSATMSPDVESLARSFARDAEKVVASAGSLTVSMVKQYHLPVQPWDKKQLLLHLLTHEEPALTVVFCRTKRTVDNLTEYLQRKGVDCHAIHGDMYQNKRNKVMEQLRSGKLEVLVASDVASRGLDVEGITHVINYDLPEDPDLYVHRIGRTARAGRDGVAWSLVTPEQGGLLTQIELLINAEIPKLDYPDFKPGPVPPDVLARQQHDAKRVETARQFNRFAAPGSASFAGGPSRAAQNPPTSELGTPGTPAAAPRPAPAPLAPDPNRFPGGIVPSQAPLKRMFGKVKTARSMKQALAQQPPPQAVVVPPQSAPAPAGSSTPPSAQTDN